jgi:hypothetical protein
LFTYGYVLKEDHLKGGDRKTIIHIKHIQHSFENGNAFWVILYHKFISLSWSVHQIFPIKYNKKVEAMDINVINAG